MAAAVDTLFVVRITIKFSTARNYILGSPPLNFLSLLWFLPKPTLRACRSGAGIVVYALKDVMLVNDAKRGMDQRASQAAMESIRAIEDQKRRLLQIALSAAFCLLSNLVVTLLTSVALKSWSESSGKWLACSVLETPRSKNWDAYGFAEVSRLHLPPLCLCSLMILGVSSFFN
jgi:hypothetical protein